jgi:hypothetical protein
MDKPINTNMADYFGKHSSTNWFADAAVGTHLIGAQEPAPQGSDYPSSLQQKV